MSQFQTDMSFVIQAGGAQGSACGRDVCRTGMTAHPSLFVWGVSCRGGGVDMDTLSCTTQTHRHTLRIYIYTVCLTGMASAAQREHEEAINRYTYIDRPMAAAQSAQR